MTVTIAGVNDVSGNSVAPNATQFTVGPGPDIASPMVTATNPASGLVNVPTNAVIALRVNEPIDPSSVTPPTFQVSDNAIGQLVTGTYTVSGDGRTISFVAAAPLAISHSHSVFFSFAGITDLAGNLLGAGGGLGNFSFTTGTTADTTGPEVAASSPAISSRRCRATCR